MTPTPCARCGTPCPSGVVVGRRELLCADCAERAGYPNAAARLRGDTEPSARRRHTEQLDLLEAG